LHGKKLASQLVRHRNDWFGQHAHLLRHYFGHDYKPLLQMFFEVKPFYDIGKPRKIKLKKSIFKAIKREMINYWLTPSEDNQQNLKDLMSKHRKAVSPWLLDKKIHAWTDVRRSTKVNFPP
jgi:hypothetical protein